MSWMSSISSATRSAKELQYDVTIIDPPSFARTKKRTFSVTKDYTQLLEELIQITAAGWHADCVFQRRQLQGKEFQTGYRPSLQEQPCDYRIMETFHLPNDFAVPPGSKTSDYLKVFIIKKLAR
jgi:23S rRNA (cytosine1962-C5)-methyltransferase